MQLFIKLITGFTHTIENVDSSFTVSDIKGEVLDKLNVPIKHQSLIYGGRQLESNETLSSLGIVNTNEQPATIHCVLLIEDIAQDDRPEHYKKLQINP